MTFSKKTFASILDLSNSGSQSTPLGLNFPNVDGGLGYIEATGDIEAPANDLASISITPTAIAGESIPDGGERSSRQNEEDGHFPATGADDIESAASDVFEVPVDRFATWTEHLGDESSSEKVKGSNVWEESLSPAASPAGSSSTMSRARREKVAVKNFQPLLSTLNKNGRPRFTLKKVRKDDRLQITMVPNDWPGVLRTTCGDGGLKIQLIDSDQEDKEEGEDEEERQEEREDGGDDDDGEATVVKGGGSRWYDGGMTEAVHGERIPLTVDVTS